MRLVPLFRARLWALFFIPAFLHAEESVNLIRDPGFEDGSRAWEVRNYGNNEIRHTRDGDMPYAGAVSMKLEMIDHRNVGAIQLVQSRLPVRPGQILRISYRARGVSNGPQLDLLIRKGGEPWTKHFQAASIPTETWEEFSYTVTLPADIDAANTQLVLQLGANGVVWIDDVKLVELPAADDGPAPTGNPVRNPSFEVGSDGWTGTFRLLDFATLREETGSNSPSPEGARLDAPDARGAPHGRRHLSFEVVPESRAAVTSAYFPARYGRPMTLRFLLRSDGEREFVASVGSGKNGNTRSDGRRSFKATQAWRAYEMPVVLKPALGGVYYLSFSFLQPGRYDLDAVSFVEDGLAPKERELYPPSFAIEPAGQGATANMFAPGDPAEFRLFVAGVGANAETACQVDVLDYLGRRVTRRDLALATDAEGRGALSFAVPTGLLGAFKIEARAAGSADLLAEQLYTVLPALPPPASRPDSFFGAHVDLTTYNMEIARRAGFRWFRLWPPLSTTWMAVEHSPGQWNFRTERVARAHEQGFRILGMLGTAPDFAADVDPKGPRSRWSRSYPPARLADWQNYITRTVEAFGPYVEAWEIWNEPNLKHLSVKPGLNKADVYLSLAQSAREALESTGKPFVMVGPALAGINEPLGAELLKKGVGAYLDAFSFHFYNLKTGGDNPNPTLILPQLDGVRAHRGHDGKPLALWHTEGGAYIGGSQSWLATYRVPHATAMTPPQAAAAIVRAAVFFKAAGVKHHFGFMADASETGRRVHEDITCGYIDVTGIPGPGVAAHAAMVSLVEDFAADGVEVREVGGARVTVANFRGDGGAVRVLWADKPVALAEVPGNSGRPEVRDMMGNPLKADAVILGEFPVYVLESR